MLKKILSLFLTASLLFCLITSCSEGLLGSMDKLREEAAEENKGETINAQKPEIIGQPHGDTYGPDEAAAPLTVSVKIDDGGTLSFQWYKNTSADYNKDGAIEGATDIAYTPDTSTLGTLYYWVVITNTNDEVSGTRIVTTYSDIVSIKVSINAQTPNITQQPLSGNYVQSAVVNLSVTATVTDGGTLSFQWYRNGTESAVGGSPVGSNSDTYQPNTTTIGTQYYYVVITNTNNSVSGEKIIRVTSDVVYITVDTVTNAQTPNITAQPVGSTYPQNAVASALSVTASITDGGTLSFQWYSNTTGNPSSGTQTKVGTDNSSYTPATASVGTIYYYVMVTNTNNSVNGAKIATATSNTAVVIVQTIVNAQTPTITGHPQGTSYEYTETASNLSVSASITDGGTPSYQWYMNTTNSTSGGTPIGTNSPIYSRPATTELGTYYYYVVVTNTNNSVNGAKTATATSNTATITVNRSLTIAITSAPGKALSPLSTELSTTFTVEARGFLTSAAANNLGLEINALPSGLSLSGHNAAGNASNGTKTFTVTVTYSTPTEMIYDPEQTITITGLTSIPSNYTYSEGNKETSLTVYDGQAQGKRAIHVNQDNLAAFGTYVRVAPGLARHYILTTSITTGMSGWTPIGTNWDRFTGSFDGDNNIISGLTISSASNDCQGLFGVIDGAGDKIGEVKNVRLQNVNISLTTRYSVGAVVGYNSCGTVRNSSIESGSVSGFQEVGGVVGLNYTGLVENCYSKCSVTGTAKLGGVVGSCMEEGIVQNCYSTGSISGENLNGGVVGFAVINSIVQNCYAKGSVSSKWDSSGGVVGQCQDSKVYNCVALNSTISCSNYGLGRVVGDFYGDSDIRNNYGSDSTTMIMNDITISIGPSDKNGLTITSSEYNNYFWWYYATAWYLSAWNFTTVWDWDNTKNLPILLGLDGQ